MTHPGLLDHHCRSGELCRAATWSADNTGRVPALTIESNTLCRSCRNWLHGATSELWNDFLGLRRAVGDRVSGGHGEIRTSNYATRSPIDVHADALSRSIADAVEHCADCIADKVGGLRECHSFADHLAVVEANLDVLIDIPMHDAMDWNRAGDDYELTEVDGPALALRLIDLHRRARSALAVDRGRDRMPLPCPRCEHSELGRWHGSSDVNCLACGSSWPEADYQRLTTVLAVDYAEFAPGRR